METETLGVIGGIALFIALLSPLFVGSTKKLDTLYEEAETLYKQKRYLNALDKYNNAYEESKKLGVKTRHIDKDFPTLINRNIALCYYDLGISTGDHTHFSRAIIFIKKGIENAKNKEHLDDLSYYFAKIAYITEENDDAKQRFLDFKKEFSKSAWMPEVLFTLGKIYYTERKYTNSLKYFNSIINQYTDSQFRKETDDYVKKIKNLSSSKQIHSDNKDAPTPKPPIVDVEEKVNKKLEIAKSLLQEGKLNEAMVQYKNLIKEYPKSKSITYAYEGLGDLFSSENNYIKARENYEEAIYSTADEERKVFLHEKYHGTYLNPTPIDPDPIDPNKRLYIDAIIQREKGNFTKAAEIFQQLVLPDEPLENQIDCFNKVSECYFSAFQNNVMSFEETVDKLKEHIQNHIDNTYSIQASYYLAKTNSEYADTTEENSDYLYEVISIADNCESKFSSIDDENIQEYLRLIKELRDTSKNRLDENPSVISIIIPDPRPEIDLVDKGFLHLENGDLKKALKVARDALKINISYQRGYQLLAEIKNIHFKNAVTDLRNNQYDKAIAGFKNTLQIDEDYAKAYCNLGVVYILMEKYNNAINELNKAIELENQLKEAHFNLGLAYFELEKYVPAKVAAIKALEIDAEYERAQVLFDTIEKIVQ